MKKFIFLLIIIFLASFSFAGKIIVKDAVVLTSGTLTNSQYIVKNIKDADAGSRLNYLYLIPDNTFTTGTVTLSIKNSSAQVIKSSDTFTSATATSTEIISTDKPLPIFQNYKIWLTRTNAVGTKTNYIIYEYED